MRISVTSRSSSVCDTFDANSVCLDDARNRDHLVSAHDEWPRLACRAGDLCVDEHVLDLFRPPGEPVAGAPGPYLKAWEIGRDPPLAPANLALEDDRSRLDPNVVVLAGRGESAAEVEPPRARRRGEQLLERGRLALDESEQVALGGRVQLAETRHDLVADQPALRVPVGRVGAEFEPLRAAVRLRLVAPHREQRPHDAVLPLRLDSLRP